MRYKMIGLLAVLASVGCAGTQSGAALTPRPPARDYGALPPNHAAEHDANLQRALHNAIERQEAEDQLQLKCHERTFQDVVYCPPDNTCYMVLGTWMVCQ